MPSLLSNSYFVQQVYQFPISVNTATGVSTVYTKVMFSSLNDDVVGTVFGFNIPAETSRWPNDRIVWLYLLLCLFTLFNGAVPDLTTMSLQSVLTNCLNNAQTSGRRATINIIWSRILPGSRQL